MKATELHEGETLEQYCKRFVDEQDITSPETIYQTDWAIENAYQFIEGICALVGYKQYDEDEE